MTPTTPAVRLLLVFALASSGASIAADVLVLRDGRRVEGTLVNVQGDTIEFQERRFGGSRTRRYARDEVQSVLFEDRERPRNDWSGEGIRPGLRERTVTVQAQQPWTATGISVRAGQTVSFSATGTVRWGPDRRDGPAGERKSPFNANRPLPDRNAAALIGRIGEGDPFFVGDLTQPIRMRDSGPLYLAINDDYLQDNSGSFRVVVAY